MTNPDEVLYLVKNRKDLYHQKINANKNKNKSVPGIISETENEFTLPQSLKRFGISVPKIKRENFHRFLYWELK